jgi:hypothetical protein
VPTTINSTLSVRRSFYRLIAFFNNTTQPGMDGNSIESPPSIRVYPSVEIKKKADALQGEMAAASKKLDEIKQADKAAFEEWAKDADKVVKAGEQLRLEGALLGTPPQLGSEGRGQSAGGRRKFQKIPAFQHPSSFQSACRAGARGGALTGGSEQRDARLSPGMGGAGD